MMPPTAGASSPMGPPSPAQAAAAALLHQHHAAAAMFAAQDRPLPPSFGPSPSPPSGIQYLQTKYLYKQLTYLSFFSLLHLIYKSYNQKISPVFEALGQNHDNTISKNILMHDGVYSLNFIPSSTLLIKFNKQMVQFYFLRLKKSYVILKYFLKLFSEFI
jgi:hypothetical protein